MLLRQVPSWFKQQRAWRRLRLSSQEVYSILLRQGVEGLGLDRTPDSITALDADILYDTLWETISAHKANSVCIVLRRVWNVLKRYGYVTNNPFEKMDLSSLSRRKQRWTEQQVNDFIAASISYGLPSMGLLLYLCYIFGQRPGDMRQLKWDDYVDNRELQFVQEKTKKFMVIWVPPFMREELALVERLGPYIITREDTHNPYTSDDYQPIFRKIRALALLPSTLQLRDARRSATTELEERGATDGEIQSITGHDRRSTINIYGINTAKTSKNAMNKRFRS